MTKLQEKLKTYDTSIEQLNIHNNTFDNQLIGEIPYSISNYSNLQYISLYTNKLSGDIPKSISKLTNLQGIDLRNNKLSGDINVLSNLINLQFLYLGNNNLSGEIPSSISKLSKLHTLYLNNNKFSGEIPSSITKLSNLRTLSLENNYFKKPALNWFLLMKNCTLIINNAFQDMSESVKKQIEEMNITNISKLQLEPIWNIISDKYSWENNDIDIIHIIDEYIAKEDILPKDINELARTKEYLKLHERDLYNWKRIYLYLKEKKENINELYHSYISKLDNIQIKQNNIIKERKELGDKLKIIIQNEKEIEEQKETIENEIKHFKHPNDKLNYLVNRSEQITKERQELDDKVKNILLNSQNLTNPISKDDLNIILSKINLCQYSNICIEHEIYEDLLQVDEGILQNIGMKSRDACCFLYNIEMMQYPNYFNEIEEDECIICEHNTSIKTIELLQEWKIECNNDIIIEENWIAPYLLYLRQYKKIGVTKQLLQFKKKLNEWKQFHNNHLSNNIIK